MMSILVQMGFGLVVIACVFCVFVLMRAFLDVEKRGDGRYRRVALAFAVSAVGVGMWAFNPLMQSCGGPPLPLIGLVVASTLILMGKSALVSSTAMGGNKRTWRAFALCSCVWIIICVLVAVL